MSPLSVACSENGIGTRRVAKVVARTVSKEDILWPVIRDHVRVTNVAEHRYQENPVPL